MNSITRSVNSLLSKGATLSVLATMVFATNPKPAVAATRSQLKTYYQSVDGLKGAQLKNALSSLLLNHTVISYGSGANKTWGAFYETDRADDGSVINRYSNATFTFGTKGSVPSGMNIEHSMPKSWWGGTNNNAYKDIHHLYPSPSADNSSKSNYPMGVVTNVTSSGGEGYDKVGKGTVNGTVQNCWEPGDGWKGDFSRTYMYMAVCYQDLWWTSMGLQTINPDSWQTLLPWAQELYLSWVRADKVDNIETKRNDAVYDIQGNRNPFIDFPFLADYLWGDSTSVAFDLTNAVTTASDDDRYAHFDASELPSDPEQPTTDPTDESVIYVADCITNTGNMTTENNTFGSNKLVWQTSDYGWKASGYVSSKAYETNATLLTPAIDLTDRTDIKLTFNHALNFIKTDDPADRLSVTVLCEGEEIALTVGTWPSGNSWDFVTSGEIDLSAFAGKSIQICFQYTSTSSIASTWEIKDVKVTGTKGSSTEETPSDIKNVLMDQMRNRKGNHLDLNKPFGVTTLNGRSLRSLCGYKGLVVVTQEGKSWLTIIR